jgi:hypothetical protein
MATTAEEHDKNNDEEQIFFPFDTLGGPCTPGWLRVSSISWIVVSQFLRHIQIHTRLLLMMYILQQPQRSSLGLYELDLLLRKPTIEKK